MIAKLFCLLFGHKIIHPKTPRKCKRCNFKFPGYCDHKWIHEIHEEIEYFPIPLDPTEKDWEKQWNYWDDVFKYKGGYIGYYSNLKCDKCGIRIWSGDYKKYISGEWV